MSQPSQFGMQSTGPADGVAVALRVNGSLDALLSSNSGPSEPVYKVRGTLWDNTSTGLLMRYNGATWDVIHTASDRIYFDAVKSVSQGLSNGATKIGFESANVNAGNAYSTSTSRFTAPRAGGYQLNIDLQMTNHTSGEGSFGVAIYKNGVLIREKYGNTNGLYIESNIAAVMSLAAGDYVEAYAKLDGLGGLPRLEALRCSFNGFLLG